jgi:RNA polymerase sigma-70 factor (ECF subfamily)
MDLDVHLQAIVRGDKRSFAYWLAGAERPVRESLRSFAKVIDVEAVLQEALLRVWQVAPRFESDGRPNGLLRLGVRIARNLAVSEVRRTRTTPTQDADLEALQEHVVMSPPDPILRQAIEACRDKLPNQPRRAIDARLTSDGAVDDTELATAVGMKLNTFLQNVTRARQLLAECLQRSGIVIDQELGA